MKQRELYDLYMERLMSIPVQVLNLPKGFTIRNITEKYGYLWEYVMDASFGNYEPGDFRYVMVNNHDYEDDRVFIMFDESGKPVATTSSWRQHYRWDNDDIGYIIFVGVIPEYRGQGLAQQMVNYILYDFERHGFSTALLNVEEDNLSAIKTYINCGFRPRITLPQHTEVWSEQYYKLGLPIPEFDKTCRPPLDVPHPASPFPYAIRKAAEAEAASAVWVHGGWKRHNMFELAPTEYYKVKPLFEPIDGCLIRIDELQRNGGGRIFADRTYDPTAALLEADDGFNYLAGNYECKEFLDGIMVYLLDEIIPRRKEGDRQLILFSSSESWKAELNKRLAPYAGFIIKRHTFIFDYKLHNQCKAQLKQLPDGYKISDSSNNNRLSISIYFDNNEVCCCEEGFTGDNQVEIGIRTTDEHRRKGLAENACTVFIDKCLLSGRKPHWSCWDYNTPSLNLALKLGFVRLPDIEVNFCEL